MVCHGSFYGGRRPSSRRRFVPPPVRLRVPSRGGARAACPGGRAIVALFGREHSPTSAISCTRRFEAWSASCASARASSSAPASGRLAQPGGSSAWAPRSAVDRLQVLHGLLTSGSIWPSARRWRRPRRTGAEHAAAWALASTARLPPMWRPTASAGAGGQGAAEQEGGDGVAVEDTHVKSSKWFGETTTSVGRPGKGPMSLA